MGWYCCWLLGVEVVRVGEGGGLWVSESAVWGVMPEALAALMGDLVWTLMGGMLAFFEQIK